MEVVVVENAKALKQFVDLPYSLYRRDPYWTPPLRTAQMDILNTRKHPFYANAESRFWLARREGRVVGRIAAILDRNYNRFQGERAGFFGFFETVQDQETAAALLDAARHYLASKGAAIVRGPMNPSSNYECGLLVEGFDSSPMVMMTYNPPWYAGLMEKAGWRKSKDLYAYTGRPEAMNRSKIMRVAKLALGSNGVRIRPINMKDFWGDVERVWAVYNSAWERNWGFVPMTREEFLHSAKDMKQVLKPGFVLIGEVGDKVVGFALALPDINAALKRAGGRLFPFGLFKILYHQRLIKSLRVIALGVVGEYQAAGVAGAFYAELISNALRLGYQDCEMSWILEDNVLMNRSLVAMGARRYKTYRIYETN